MRSDETIPRFLWRLAWGGLFTVIAAGLVGVIVLAAGAADPPRAGPLVYQGDSGDNIPLPNPPYTLEVTGHVSPTSDPAAAWGVELVKIPSSLSPLPQGEGNQTVGNSSSPSLLAERGAGGEVNLRILVNGYGFFSVMPLQPDFTPFIHIRTHGESNKLTLNVGNDGQGVLRINDEIAWKGTVPSAHSAIVRLIGNAQFTLDRAAVYAP